MREHKVILCSDGGCEYNSGGGYYGVCHNPVLDPNKRYFPVDRDYRSTCDLSTSISKLQKSGDITEEEIEELKKTLLEV